MATTGDLGAFGSGGPFTGFASADFDAYEKKRWASNAFTLARRTAKDKMLALVRVVQEELGEDVQSLELGASDEAPSVANGRKVDAQWVFFTREARDRAALKPMLNKTDLQSTASLFDIAVHHQHACIFLRLDLGGLSIGLDMANKATVDLENASQKLKREKKRDELLEMFRSLPGGTLVSAGDSQKSSIDVTAEDLVNWSGELDGSGSSFRAQVTLQRDEGVLQSDGLIGTAIEHVGAFMPLYRFLAWAPENDHTEIKEAIAVEKEKQAKGPAFKSGDRVVMLAGLFAGRAGYLAEVDEEKGKAKVMVGPVGVNVDLKDLKVNG